jgi:hypothetical protein
MDNYNLYKLVIWRAVPELRELQALALTPTITSMVVSESSGGKLLFLCIVVVRCTSLFLVDAQNDTSISSYGIVLSDWMSRAFKARFEIAWHVPKCFDSMLEGIIKQIGPIIKEAYKIAMVKLQRSWDSLESPCWFLPQSCSRRRQGKQLDTDYSPSADTMEPWRRSSRSKSRVWTRSRRKQFLTPYGNKSFMI